MTIPRIEHYDIPARHELPNNRLSSNFDPSKAVLLVHDAQQYFLDFFGTENNTITRVLENIVALREACHVRGVPTVYTAQPPVQTLTDRGLLQDMWGPGITAYPDRAEISPLLTPRPSDLVLTKWRYSAFARTELLTWMHAQQRTQLIICGVYAHIGCQCTAADAFMSDITPLLVSDAVADFSRAKHLSALEYVAGCCGLVFDTEHVLATLRSANRAPTATQQTRPVEGVQRPDDIQDQLRRDVARLLELDVHGLLPTTSLFDVGMDSVRLMTLVEQWRGKGYSAELLDLAETPTIAAWADKLKPLSTSAQ